MRSDSAWKASESLTLGCGAGLLGWLAADERAEAAAMFAITAVAFAVVVVGLTLRAARKAEARSELPGLVVRSREPWNWRPEAVAIGLLALGWLIGGALTVASLTGIVIGYGVGAAVGLLVVISLERHRDARFVVVSTNGHDERAMIALPRRAVVGMQRRRM